MRYVTACEATLAVMILAGPRAVAAQGSPVSGKIRVFGDSVHVVAGAEVTVVDLGRTVRAGADGSYLIPNVPAGGHTLRVRRIGFEPAATDIRVTGAAQTVNLFMRAGVQPLTEIVIRGTRALVPAKVAEAYQRVDRGTGHYFTRAKLDSLLPYDLKSILPTLPGIHVNARGIEFTRCRSGAALGSEAPVQVYVDGTRMTSYTAGELSRGVNEALATVPISAIDLVEVYSSAVTIPPEFASDACAVIAIWTR